MFSEFLLLNFSHFTCLHCVQGKALASVLCQNFLLNFDMVAVDSMVQLFDRVDFF